MLFHSYLLVRLAWWSRSRTLIVCWYVIASSPSLSQSHLCSCLAHFFTAIDHTGIDIICHITCAVHLLMIYTMYPLLFAFIVGSSNTQPCLFVHGHFLLCFQRFFGLCPPASVHMLLYINM